MKKIWYWVRHRLSGLSAFGFGVNWVPAQPSPSGRSGKGGDAAAGEGIAKAGAGGGPGGGDGGNATVRGRRSARADGRQGTSDAEPVSMAVGELDAVAAALNSRPRKTLGWKPPAEVFTEHLLLVQQGGVATTG